MLKNRQELKQLLQSRQRIQKLAVAAAHDEHTLQAVVQAVKERLVEPILIGDPERIQSIWTAIAGGLPLPTVVAASDDEACAKHAVAMAREKQVDCIMKGKLETGTMMRAVVNRESGIRDSKVMSLIAVMDSPYYHKLFAVTDVGLLTYPTLEQKVGVIENAVELFHRLGVETPKVAVLAAVEKENPKMPETVDAARLKEMGAQGEISGCIVEGPISYDLCMDAEAAKVKGYQSPVAGDPDILVVPDIVAGNLLSKSLTCSGGAHTCGTVWGAKVPIILTSRSAPTEDKYMSIILSAAAGKA